MTSSRHQGGAFAFCMVRDWQVLWRRVLTGAWAAITVPFGYGALRRCGSRVKVRSVQHAQPGNRMASFASQGNHWIDFGRSSRRDVAGEEVQPQPEKPKRWQTQLDQAR